MKLIVSDRAKDYVSAHGGVLYVRSHEHRCCSTPITLLDTRTTPPPDLENPVRVETGDILVMYQGDRLGMPHELTIELRGLVRRHLVAYWDGCAYKP